MEIPAQNPTPVLSNRKEKFRSLTVSLVIVFLGLLSLVLFVNNGLNIFFNYQKEQNIIAANQSRLAADAASIVGEFIENKFRLLDQAAYINDLAANIERRSLVLSKLMGRNPSFRQLQLVDLKGQTLQKISRFS